MGVILEEGWAVCRKRAWNEKGGEDGIVKLWSGEAGNRNKRKGRGRELSATLLPVLVKCCVLSKRQPRMCQPSRLTLPNGLLNADIKLTRSFALPFSSLARSLSFSAFAACSHYLSFSPFPSLSLTCPLPLFLFFCCSVYQPLTFCLFLFS